MGFTDVSCDKKCAICGKGFVVLHQDLWRYRRGAKWLCSWSCLREYDKKKEERKLRKLTLEDKKKAVEIAVGGGDALAFLATKCDDPSQMWARIRNNIKDTDPETFAKLPKRVDKPKKVPAVEIPEVQEAEDGGFFSTGEAVETPERPKVVKPEPKFDALVIVSRATKARYEYSEEFGQFSIKYGADEILMEPAVLKKFYDELPDAAKRLGVEL